MRDEPTVLVGWAASAHRDDGATRLVDTGCPPCDKVACDLLKANELALLDPKIRSNRVELDRLIADEFFEVGASGSTFGKAELVLSLPDESGIYFEALDVKVNMLSSTVGLVTYTTARMSGESVQRSRRASIWVKTGEQWQMIYHQGTVVKEADDAL